MRPAADVSVGEQLPELRRVVTREDVKACLHYAKSAVGRKRERGTTPPTNV